LQEHFDKNITIITAFLPNIGYEKAENLINNITKRQNDFRNFWMRTLATNLLSKRLILRLMALGYRKPGIHKEARYRHKFL